MSGDGFLLTAQDVFLAIVKLLSQLTMLPPSRLWLMKHAAAHKRMIAVAQMLKRRVDAETKYLARLDGEVHTPSALPTTSARCPADH